MKGQILDVYPEGSETFRACVIKLEMVGRADPEEMVRVINLSTGAISNVHHWECEDPIIDDIFK